MFGSPIRLFHSKSHNLLVSVMMLAGLRQHSPITCILATGLVDHRICT